MIDYIFLETDTVTRMEKGTDNYWTVNLVVIYYRSSDGETWEEHSESFKSIDKNLPRAVDTVNKARFNLQADLVKKGKTVFDEVKK